MKFELALDNSDVWGSNPPWIVDRVTSRGERYLVARFEHRCDANALMEVLQHSIEWKTQEVLDGKSRQPVFEANGSKEAAERWARFTTGSVR